MLQVFSARVVSVCRDGALPGAGAGLPTKPVCACVHTCVTVRVCVCVQLVPLSKQQRAVQPTACSWQWLRVLLQAGASWGHKPAVPAWHRTAD